MSDVMAEGEDLFGDGDYVLCGEVNAKNSFGGYSGFKNFQVATLDGKAFAMVDTYVPPCKGKVVSEKAGPRK